MGLIDKIAAAGIVGCGGAGFPTHVKLKGRFEYFIVNGAECEPLLRTDRYLMRNKAREIVEAICAIAKELSIPHSVIGLKEHYREETAALRKAISDLGAPVELHLLDSFYPAGDEQTIVYEVTGRVVPPAGLPVEVGAVVDNVATVYAVYQAMQGHPLILKYLTVTGEVENPVVLRVPVGTSVRRCIELAGGEKPGEHYYISGGPMMGQPIADPDKAVVTKTTSGILVLPADGYHARQNAVPVRAMLNRARSACIQCTTCSQLCPRHMLGHPLEPHKIMRKVASGIDIKDLLDDPDIRNAQLCCECGVCEIYACPMDLQPRRMNSIIKRELGAAKIRYERKGSEWHADALREDRLVPSERLAARAGVRKYYDYEITELVTDEPDEVRIPLKMHVGAPSVPVVSVGDAVSAGDLIAKPPEGALGANIHASVSGKISDITDFVTITKN